MIIYLVVLMPGTDIEWGDHKFVFVETFVCSLFNGFGTVLFRLNGTVPLIGSILQTFFGTY